MNKKSKQKNSVSSVCSVSPGKSDRMMNHEEESVLTSQLLDFLTSAFLCGLVFVLNFETLNFDIVSNFEIRASCFIFILGEIKKGHTRNLPGEIEKKVGSKPIIL